MRVFISQPMRGKTREEILEERGRIVESLKEKYGDIEVIDSVLEDYSEHNPLHCLGKSLELLSTADAAYFARGWLAARGCRLEHQCCVEYGIKVI